MENGEKEMPETLDTTPVPDTQLPADPIQDVPPPPEDVPEPAEQMPLPDEPEAMPLDIPDQEPEVQPEPASEPEPTADPVDEPKEEGLFDELYNTLFSKSWPMWVGCILLSVFSITLFLIASPWGSSGGILNWGQNLFEMIGIDQSNSAPNGVTQLLDNRYAMLSIVMLIGAMGSALMAKEFAIRVAPKGELVKGFIGGSIMGIGAIIGMGCTIGNLYSGLPALSGGALVFVLGLFVGVFIAVKYILWEMEKFPNMSMGKSCTFLGANTKRTSLQPLAGIIVLAIGGSLAFLYNATSDMVLIGFILIGLMIGVVLQRSRFCVVRTMRETFLTGDSTPTAGLIAGILVGLLGFTVIKIMGIGSETSMVASNFWVPSIIGGIIFGFGMTIAGGCTVGSTWRAGEGHVKLWLSLVGLVMFLPLTAEYIKPAFMDMLTDDMKQKIFLPDYFDYGGGICLMILILLVWYLFAKWNDRTGKLTAL